LVHHVQIAEDLGSKTNEKRPMFLSLLESKMVRDFESKVEEMLVREEDLMVISF
jgi:hypothetical protein